MGVLQRFGIAYLVIASLYVLFYKENVINSQNNETQRTGLIDITSLLPQWFIMLIITSIHLLVIFYLPIPNCGSGGYFGPGGINKMSKFTDCIGGATGYVDRLIIGKSHLYQRPRAASIYDEKQPFDPYVSITNPLGCNIKNNCLFYILQRRSFRLFVNNCSCIFWCSMWAITSAI